MDNGKGDFYPEYTASVETLERIIERSWVIQGTPNTSGTTTTGTVQKSNVTYTGRELSTPGDGTFRESEINYAEEVRLQIENESTSIYEADGTAVAEPTHKLDIPKHNGPIVLFYQLRSTNWVGNLVVASLGITTIAGVERTPGTDSDRTNPTHASARQTFTNFYTRRVDKVNMFKLRVDYPWGKAEENNGIVNWRLTDQASGLLLETGELDLNADERQEISVYLSEKFANYSNIRYEVTSYCEVSERQVRQELKATGHIISMGFFYNTELEPL